MNQALTKRQTQVHALLSAGLSNEQIAKRLGISESTTQKHVHKVYKKTGKGRFALIQEANKQAQAAQN